MAPFIVSHFISQEQLKLRVTLSKVFMIAYCKPFARSNFEDHRLICQEFVDTANQLTPHVMKKCKIHLLLHLPHNMQDFGPTSAYNTERCETFNGLMRAQNIYSNKQAPSRDIAQCRV